MKHILSPITISTFAVKNVESQVFLDKTRKLFDSAIDGGGWGTLFIAIDSTESVESLDVLHVLLAAGLDPDLPVRGFHASHLCGEKGLIDAARSLFLCRPDMNVKDPNGNTPVQAADENRIYEVR